MKSSFKLIGVLLICLLQFGCKKKPNIAISEQNKLLVYPNPCQTRVNLSVVNVEGTNYTLGVMGTDGKEIINVAVNNQDTKALNLDDKPNGKYVAYLTNGTNTYTQTFYKFD